MEVPMDSRKVAIGVGSAAVVAGVVLLAAKAKAPPEKELADLHGIVADSVTGSPVSSVLVSLDGDLRHTDTNGYFMFAGLSPSSYNITFEKEGYRKTMSTVILSVGDNELNVRLVPLAAPAASLYGVVTDAMTGLPISGVRVSIDNLATYTNANGEYLFEGLAPGAYVVVFSKEGYASVTR